MSIEKINTALPVAKGLSFKGEDVVSPKEVEVDEEKSSSMSKKIGLCAAAAIAIGGIILYARKGKAPKSSFNVSVSGGGGASSAASSTTSSAAGSGSTAPAFEPVKKFMKKLEDGTEYLLREETRDNEGHLVKSVCYSPEGKVVRVREFKMAPAGVTDPARNVVASEIRYDKEGKIIYRRTEKPDFSGYDIERLVDDETVLVKGTYVENRNRNRFRPQLVSGVGHDAATGRKLCELEFGPGGEDDVIFFRRFDKKTGTKVVESKELSDDTYQSTLFGQGKSRQVSTYRTVEGEEDELIQFEKYDSEGGLRILFTETQGGSFTRIANPKKGRATIVEEENGVKHVSRTYQKKGETYTQKFFMDEANPKKISRIEVYKGSELERVITPKGNNS